jgi:hypothetical protein
MGSEPVMAMVDLSGILSPECEGWGGGVLEQWEPSRFGAPKPWIFQDLKQLISGLADLMCCSIFGPLITGGVTAPCSAREVLGHFLLHLSPLGES